MNDMNIFLTQAFLWTLSVQQLEQKMNKKKNNIFKKKKINKKIVGNLPLGGFDFDFKVSSSVCSINISLGDLYLIGLTPESVREGAEEKEIVF